MADLREMGIMAWVGLLWIGYVFLRVILRILIGKERRNWVQQKLGLHYGAGWHLLHGILSLRAKYEPHVARVISKVLEKGGSTFIDLGAFVGIHTLYAYKIVSKRSPSLIVAVEPSPRNFQELVNRLPKTGIIKAVRLAVWTGDNEEVEFHLGSESHAASGGITPTEWHRRDGFLSDETIKVKTIRLDTLVKRMGLSVVDLVKMDIEGAEYHVLTDPTLDLSAVRNLVVEVHYNIQSRESMEIHRSLRKKGYSVFILPPELDGRRYHLIATRDSEIPW